MKQKVEDPLNALEKDINKLEGNIQRSGKIMSNMQNSVEKLKFKGHKPIPPVKKQEDVPLVRRPEMQASDVDDGCVFSGTASGKSANVKVRTRICFSFGTLCKRELLQGSKMVPSVHLGQVDFPGRQVPVPVTFHSHLPDGQGSRQVVCQLNLKRGNQDLHVPRASKFESCFSEGQGGLQVFCEPCTGCY